MVLSSEARVNNASQASNTSSSVSRTTPVDHHSSSHPIASSQFLFQNARDFEVRDSQFNNMTIVNNTANIDPVSTILWPHVVAGAIFDSAARYNAGKCHPGTRKKIIERIVDWINDPDPNQRILWLYGPAGAGKSAIAHTICELLKQSYPDSYGGCFFFVNGPTDRGNALKLFATLSYQLVIHFPSLRTEVNNTLFLDPSLPTKSMEIQLYSLIVQPLLRCQSIVSHSPTLIIDGLDECADDDTQRKIVTLIAKYILDYNLPLRFLIASRPEYWIRDVFDTPPVPSISLLLSLRDDIDADKDIKAYLTDEFEKIRLENKRIMKSVATPWPPTNIVERFVEEASGQYIYAATILKFVGNFSRFSSPQKQLEILISCGPHRALAFSDLDRLYATIISPFPRWKNMKRVLAGILVGANATILEVVLDVDSDELVLVLDALSSLIVIKEPTPLLEEDVVWESVFGYFPDGRDTISFCHRSFQQFLQDESRSGTFFIDLDSDSVPTDIVNGYFDMVQRNIGQNYEIEPPLFLNMDLATYHDTMQMVTFLSVRRCSIGTLLPLIINMTSKLEHWKTGKLTHMQSLFYLIREMEHLEAALQELFDGRIFRQHEHKEKKSILAEFQAACTKFADALDLLCRIFFAALPSCTDFEVTPALVYLAEYQRLSARLHIHELSMIAGVADGISTLRQYRYLVPLYSSRQVDALPFVFYPLFWKEDPCWRKEGAWRDLRISFAQESLELIMHGHNLESLFFGVDIDDQYSALTEFFDSPRISDISSKEYFKNLCNITILEAITDLEAWACLLHEDSGNAWRQHFILSVMCWINRQLTNLETITFLKEYDEALQQTLTITMKYIFDHSLLSDFKFYKQGLWAFTQYAKGKTRVRSIQVRPLPQDIYEKEKDSSHLTNGIRSNLSPDIWRTFHDKVFGKLPSTKPIIDPSHWYPHLFSRLLKDLVRFLYGLIHPQFLTYLVYEEVHPYLIQCLPYAQPTPDNLDALRAIVCLYPRVTPDWNAPKGFWSLLVEFLQKYDRSLLSSEELDLFVKWLNSPDHADITTYV